MALNKVEICGVNTSRLPVLTNEEKELLFEKIKKGDKEARELYIKGNLRLVLSVIKRFSGSNENADDLFQIHGALVHPLQDRQGQHEFDDALHGIGRLIPHHDGFPRIQHFRSHAHTGLQGMGQFAYGGGIRCGNGWRRRRGPLRKNAKEHDATA